ncbi:hypothetical protein MTO96_038459 [Rhipicephalus appendiculatus]
MDDTDAYQPSKEAKELAAASMPPPGTPSARPHRVVGHCSHKRTASFGGSMVSFMTLAECKTIPLELQQALESTQTAAASIEKWRTDLPDLSDEEDMDLTASRKRTRNDSSDEEELAPRKQSATTFSTSDEDHSSQSSEGQESTSTPSTATSVTTTASKAPADLTPSIRRF